MKQLTILGRGDDWKECEFKTEELWGTVTCLITPVLGDKPFTKVFAFDAPDMVIDGKPRTNHALVRAISFAKELKIPIVGQLPYVDEIYPLRDIVQEFRWGLLRNTVSYMMALAIYLKYDRIYVHGLGGRSRADYDQNKMYLVSWHGVAIGRGIDIRVGRGSSRWLYDVPTIKYDRPEVEGWHEERMELPCVLSK